jgi:hypothetical protein
MAVFISLMYAIVFFAHRQKETGRHIAHHRLAVARTASESSSSSSVSHEKSRFGPIVAALPVVTAAWFGTPRNTSVQGERLTAVLQCCRSLWHSHRQVQPELV